MFPCASKVGLQIRITFLGGAYLVGLLFGGSGTLRPSSVHSLDFVMGLEYRHSGSWILRVAVL